jgi:hypothetical protein
MLTYRGRELPTVDEGETRAKKRAPPYAKTSWSRHDGFSRTVNLVGYR